MATNMMTVTGVIILQPLDERENGAIADDAIFAMDPPDEKPEGKTDAILRFRPLGVGEDEKNSQEEFSGFGPLEDREVGKNFGTEVSGSVPLLEEENEPFTDDHNYRIFRKAGAAGISGRKNPRCGCYGTEDNSLKEDGKTE